MFYFDPTYIVLIPALILSIWASARVNSVYRKYSTVYSRRGYTAAMACRTVLDRNGLYGVRIEHIGGNLTDHYDPRENVIRLSDSVYNSTSAAAIGVACHEAGHAIQYANNYAPIKIRQAIIPITNVGSTAGIWIFIIGVLLTSMSEAFVMIAYVGLILFSFTALFQLVTLPTEFNASRRALDTLSSCGILYSDEIKDAGKVLSAAAMTYVAALAVALANILRLLAIVNRRR